MRRNQPVKVPLLYGPNGKPLRMDNNRELLRNMGVDADAYTYKGYTFLPNDDDLVDRKGFEIWDTMLNEVEIENSVNAIRYKIMSSQHEIIPASPSSKDIEIAEFVRWDFENCKGSILDFIFEILSAVYRGYSIAEKVFYIVHDGKYRGMWAHERLAPKYAGDYEIVTDEYLNITDLQLTAKNATGESVPLDKFIIYTHNPRDGKPHGRSVLRSVYKHYWAKDFILKWWCIYLETFGIPTRIAQYPSGSYAQTASGSNSSQATLQSILRDIMAATAITIPDDIKLDFKEPNPQGSLAIERAIKYHDTQMVRGIQGQTLTSTSGDGSGSYALGDVHAGTKMDYTTRVRRSVEEAVFDEQIIKQLVDLNYGKQPHYPRFSLSNAAMGLETITADDATKWKSAGVLIAADLDTIRARRFGLPPIQVAKEASGIDEEQEEIPVPAAMPGNAEPDEIPKFAMGRKPFLVEGRTDFKAIDTAMTNDADALMVDLSVVVQEMQDKMLAYLPKRVFVDGKVNTAEVTSLKLIGLSKFANIYKQHTRGIIEREIERAFNEAEDPTVKEYTLREAEDLEQFASIVLADTRPAVQEIAIIRAWRESGNWKALRAWRDRKALELAGVADAQAFWVTDVVKSDILSEVKSAIYSGVGNKSSVQAIMSVVKSVFEKYIQRGDVQNKALASAPRLENIVRTNLNRTYNTARYEAFKATAATGNFPAMEYSAILDDRTSDICESLDGKIYPVDDPIWNTITPPNHHNCRSLLVPVHKDDVPEKWSDNPDVRNISAEFGGLGK